MFIGSVIFEFVGVSIRWLFHRLFSLLKGRKSKTFKEVWDGPKDYNGMETTAYSFYNIILGAFIIVLICFIIVESGW